MNNNEKKEKHNLQFSESEVAVLINSIQLSLWLLDWVHPRVSYIKPDDSPYADSATPDLQVLEIEKLLRKIMMLTKVLPEVLSPNIKISLGIIEEYATLIANKKHEYYARHQMDPINEQTGEVFEYPEDPDYFTYIYGKDFCFDGGTCRI